MYVIIKCQVLWPRHPQVVYFITRYFLEGDWRVVVLIDRVVHTIPNWDWLVVWSRQYHIFIFFLIIFGDCHPVQFIWSLQTLNLVNITFLSFLYYFLWLSPGAIYLISANPSIPGTPPKYFFKIHLWTKM